MNYFVNQILIPNSNFAILYVDYNSTSYIDFVGALCLWAEK